MQNLTTSEIQILEKIGTSAFSYFDDGVEVNSNTYTAHFAWEIADLLGTNEKAAGGHITNLIKKGIFSRFVYSGDTGIELTQHGVDTINALQQKVGA
jgi:hypothetical protein